MKKELYMGIDIGTSSVRAVNFDREGNVCGAHQIEYTLICDEPGMAELDPDLVFAALMKCVRVSIENAGADKTDVAAIGISTQMHSIMAVDEKGVPVTNLMTWADTRPMAQAEAIVQNFDTYALYQRTGCRNQHPMYPLSKICWLRDTHPETYAKAYKFLSIKSYVLSKLYGDYYMDYADAGSSACFNLYAFDWDDVILGEVIGVSKDKFPKPVPCDFVLRGMKPHYAAEMNLCEDVPLAIGAGDGMMANLGCGVFDDTRMSCTVGTSGALRILVKEPLLDPKERTWCYSFLKDGYLAGGAINNGGIVLKWLREEWKNEYAVDMEKYGVKKMYQLFDEYAKELPAGSEGLIMLPYLTGERSPGWRADAKAVISGITLRHGRRHFAKAAMESVMYQMHSVFEAITSVNNHVKTIIANGGYASSDVWLQIQADIFDRDIAVSNVGEASAFGAAYTGMIAVGVVRDFRTGAKIMEPKRVISPNPANVEVYRECYQQFRKLYEEIYGGR